MRMCNRIVVVQNGAIAEQGRMTTNGEEGRLRAARQRRRVGWALVLRNASRLLYFLSFFYFILFIPHMVYYPSICTL